MKILIAYASKNGTVKECVNRLSRALDGLEVTVADLNQKTPSVSEYDLVVTGSSVRFGRLLKAERRFLKEQCEALQNKTLCLFLCCGLAHEYEYYRENLFPKALRDHAYQNLYFGGSLRPDGLSLFDKLMVKAIRSSIAESEIEDGEYTPSMPGILPENIERMATYIRMKLIENT